MSDRVAINITATDGASRVFQQVASGADRLDTSLDKVERRQRRLTIAGAAMGAALGVASGLLGEAARKSAEAEVSQARLQASIEATGASYEEYAAQLEAAGAAAVAMGFDDEAAADSISFLTQATGDAARSIDNLGLVMDIARARGIELAAASKIVAAAELGRYGQLARIGIVLDANATKEEAIAALQAKFAGQAEAYAATSLGFYDELGNRLENVQESVGAHAGSLQTLLILMPGLSAGYLAATAGLGALTGGMGKAAIAARALSLAMGPAGIVVALGATALAISAFTDTLGTEFHQASETVIADVDALIAKVVELGDTSALGSLVVSLDTVTAEYKEMNDAANQVLDTMPGLIAEAQMMDDANADTVEGLLMVSAAFDEFTQAQKDTIDANDDGIATVGELTSAFAEFEAQAISTQSVLDGLSAGSDELAQVFAMTGEGAAFAKSEALAYTEALLAGDITGAEYEHMLQALVTGYGNTQEATLAAEATQEQWRVSVAASTEEVLKLADALSTSLADAGRGLMGTSGMLNEFELWESQLEDTDQAALDLADTLSTSLAAAGRGLMGTSGMLNEFELWESQLTETDQAALALADTLSSTLAAAGRGRIGLSGLDDTEAIKAGTDAMRERIGVYQELEAAIAGPVQAFDNAFRVIVQNTNGIVSSLESAHTWIDSLVMAVDREDVWGNWIGAWSEMDEILAKGEISLTDYNAAMQAHEVIAWSAARTQTHMNALQIEWAPLIAQSAENLAEYAEGLRHLPEDQQLAALGFMDTASAAQAMELQMFAMSGATDQAMDNIIGGAARADPVLAAMLESMGLIAIGANGEVLVSVGGHSEVENLTSALQTLTQSMWIVMLDGDIGAANEAYNEAFGLAENWENFAAKSTIDADNTPAIDAINLGQETLDIWGGSTGVATVDGDAGPFNTVIEGGQTRLDTWGASSAAATVAAIDNASGPIGAAQNALNAFGGTRTATLYVDTIYRTFGSGPTPFALGGVASHAVGGVVAKMAEWGPELLHYPNGGVALARTPGIYTVPQGTYVDTAPATAAKLGGGGGGFTFNNYGTIIGVKDLEEQIIRAWAQATQRATQIQQRSFA